MKSDIKTIVDIENIMPIKLIGVHAGTIPLFFASVMIMIKGIVKNIDHTAPAVVAFFHRRPKYIAGTHALKAAVENRNAYIIVAVPMLGLKDPQYTTTAITTTATLDAYNSCFSVMFGKSRSFNIDELNVAEAC